VKPIDFHPRALEFIRTQSPIIRRRLGEALRDLQKGVNLGMPLSRPMSLVAPGVRELRVRDENAAVRVFYFTGASDAILVFHGFQKKGQKTPARDIDLARRRLKEVIHAKVES